MTTATLAGQAAIVTAGARGIGPTIVVDGGQTLATPFPS